MILLILLSMPRPPTVCTAWHLPLGQAPLTQRDCGSKITVAFPWVAWVTSEQEQHVHFQTGCTSQRDTKQWGGQPEILKGPGFHCVSKGWKRVVINMEASFFFLKSGCEKVSTYSEQPFAFSDPFINRQRANDFMQADTRLEAITRERYVMVKTLRMGVGRGVSLPSTGWYWRWQPQWLLRSLSSSLNVRCL